MTPPLSVILDGAENSNAAAQSRIWREFKRARPLTASLFASHANEIAIDAAIAWARAEVEDGAE